MITFENIYDETSRGIITDPAYKGYLGEGARTNLFLNSTAPVTQDITTTAQSYTISVLGTGDVTVSGTAAGTATEGNPLTVTATAGTMTCTVTGTLSRVQVEAGAFASSFIDTGATTVTRPATVLAFPTEGILRAQNCAVYGRVVPAASHDGKLLSAGSSLEVSTSSGSVVLTKGVETASAAVDLTKPIEYQAAWTDQGMLVRTRSYDSTWSAWSAWGTNANTVAATVATDLELGSSAGASHFNGNYPMLATMFLPDRASLAEYQTYIENTNNWRGVV